MTAPTPPPDPAGPAEGNAPDPASTPDPAPQASGQEQGQQPDNRPPWERNGETFDPERAWKRLQDLEADRNRARQARDQHKARLDEIERSQMTEAQQVAADRDSFRTRAEAAEQQLARFEVAAEKGLDPKAMRFLTGSTREELAASADELMALLGAQAAQAAAVEPAVPATQRPMEALRVPAGGSDPGSQLSADDLDPMKLAAQLRRTR